MNKLKQKIFLLALLLSCFLSMSQTIAQERFPEPTQNASQETEDQVIQLGKQEVFTLSYSDLCEFIIDRYWKGPYQSFHYFDANPSTLSPLQAKKPATLFLHGYKSNQGHWIPLLQEIDAHNKNCLSSEEQSGPLFTLNYQEEAYREELIKKIEEIKALYLQSGESEVDLYLVGHSLGAIASASYAFDPVHWVTGTHVKKVISIAGRLKNIEPPTETPYYPFCYCVLLYLDDLWRKIEEHRGIVHLYAIAAENDWLVPIESVLVGDNASSNAIIPNTGHTLVPRNKETAQQLISWLFNDKE